MKYILEFIHVKRAKLEDAPQDGSSGCAQHSGDFAFSKLSNAQAEGENTKCEAVLAKRAAHLEAFRAMRDSKTAELQEKIFQANAKLENPKTRNQKNVAKKNLERAIQDFTKLLEEWDSKDPKKEAAELYPMPPIGVGELL